jgi:hypothetical protein
LRYDVRGLSGELRREAAMDVNGKYSRRKFVASAMSASAISVLPGAQKLRLAATRGF